MCKITIFFMFLHPFGVILFRVDVQKNSLQKRNGGVRLNSITCCKTLLRLNDGLFLHFDKIVRKKEDQTYPVDRVFNTLWRSF